MKQVTQQIRNAWLANMPTVHGNTAVSIEPTKCMYLHGHMIAKVVDGKLFVTNAGYATNVTKDRLNVIPEVLVTQQNYNWYLNGEKWDGNWREV